MEVLSVLSSTPESLLDTLKLVGVLGFAWFCLHLLCNLFVRPIFLGMLSNNPKMVANPAKREKVSHMLSPRMVCFVHNIIQIPLAMAILTNTKYYSNRAVAHDTFSSTVMAISAGYFLYDSIECIVNYASEGPAFVVHGVACGSVYITLLHTGVLHWFGAGFLLWELSTPFLHLRWLLIQIGQGSSPLFDLVQKAGFVVFFLCRIVWGYYLTITFYLVSWRALKDPVLSQKLPLLLVNVWRALSIVLNGLNTMWFLDMVKIALAPPAPTDLKVN